MSLLSHEHISVALIVASNLLEVDLSLSIHTVMLLLW